MATFTANSTVSRSSVPSTATHFQPPPSDSNPTAATYGVAANHAHPPSANVCGSYIPTISSAPSVGRPANTTTASSAFHITYSATAISSTSSPGTTTAASNSAYPCPVGSSTRCVAAFLSFPPVAQSAPTQPSTPTNTTFEAPTPPRPLQPAPTPPPMTHTPLHQFLHPFNPLRTPRQQPTHQPRPSQPPLHNQKHFCHHHHRHCFLLPKLPPSHLRDHNSSPFRSLQFLLQQQTDLIATAAAANGAVATAAAENKTDTGNLLQLLLQKRRPHVAAAADPLPHHPTPRLQPPAHAAPPMHPSLCDPITSTPLAAIHPPSRTLPQPSTPTFQQCAEPLHPGGHLHRTSTSCPTTNRSHGG